MRHFLVFIILVFSSSAAFAQYQFKGVVDSTVVGGKVYLSIVEDYRKMSGVYAEQILQQSTPNALGEFTFTGNNLPETNRIYRIHFDTCEDEERNHRYFDGHCSHSEEVLFIANNQDTITLPSSFDDQIFCAIEATNERANAFLQIDSLMNDMRFDFSTFQSQANKKVTMESWFEKLKRFSKDLNEPLAELYMYSLISDRKSELHTYYLSDLKYSNYYDELLTRLNTAYPKTSYTTQFDAEFKADQFLIDHKKEKLPWWVYLIGIAALVSLLVNFYLVRERKRKVVKHTLSQQEQRVLSLILENKTNKEIAEEIFVSVSTVKTHINNLYRKLGVSSREEVKNTYRN